MSRILTPHPTQRNDANALDAIACSRYRVCSVPELADAAAGVPAVRVPTEATPDMLREIAMRFAFDPQQEDLDMAAEAWRAALRVSGVGVPALADQLFTLAGRIRDLPDGVVPPAPERDQFLHGFAQGHRAARIQAAGLVEDASRGVESNQK